MPIRIPATSANAKPVVVPDHFELTDAVGLAITQLGDGLIPFSGMVTSGPLKGRLLSDLNGEVIPGTGLKVRVRDCAVLLDGVVLAPSNPKQFDAEKLTDLVVPAGALSYLVLRPKKVTGTDGAERPDMAQGVCTVEPAAPNVRTGFVLATVNVPTGATQVTTGMINMTFRKFLTNIDSISTGGGGSGGGTTFNLVNPLPGTADIVYPSGTYPASVCINGTDIWVAGNDGTIVKIAKSTGVRTIYGPGAPYPAHPLAIVSAGSFVWVSDYVACTVTKILASTGAVAGTYSLGAATSANSLCFDGTDVWVASPADSTVIKVQASTGAILGVYPTGIAPYHVISVGDPFRFPGPTIWTANLGDGTVTKILASTGAVVGTYPAGSVAPMSLCSDGTDVWAKDVSGNSLTKLSGSTGEILSTIAIPVPHAGNGAGPGDTVVLGGNIWSVISGSIDEVMQVDKASGSVIQFAGGWPDYPYSLTTDGSEIWVGSIGANTVSRLVTSYPANPAPTSSSFPGAVGDVDFDANFIYICVAPNSWVRAALHTF